MSKVAILGCGPSGLLCAWAAEVHNHMVHIYSKKQKSVIPGSQHLHGPVPGITSPYPEGVIQFVRMGTAQEYARKVYGDEDRETGWTNYLQMYPSWNVQHAYDALWNRYVDRIQETQLPPEVIDDIVRSHDLVISTVPAQVLCSIPDFHEFREQEYWIKRLPTPEADAEHEIVVYNGLRSDHWYRWSILGGLCSIESTSYSHTDDAWERGAKAIDNDCDCWPTIQRCGRWAEWRHGVTMYKAYQKADRLAREL